MAGLEGLILILGNTKGTLQRNVIEPMQRIWGTGLVSDIRQDNTAFMFGERVHCLGADKISQVDVVRGLGAKYIYGDEIITWHKEVFEMIKSRLDKPYSRFDGTCNPGSPAHWFKEFIDSDVDMFYQQYSIYDNDFLDPTVRVEMEKEHVGVFFTRYILGEWVRAEGLIYPQFKKDNIEAGGHLFTDTQLSEIITANKQSQDEGEFVISVDYGTANPTSAGLWRIIDSRGFRLKEYYHDGRKDGQLTDEEHMNNIFALAESVEGAYPTAQVIIDPSAASLITCFRRNGMMQVVPADNEVMGGIRNTASALNNSRILFHESCKNAIKELQDYVWDDKSKEDEEKPLKENDHAADDVRYFVRTYLKRYYKDFA